jgi:WD repeat-containing protein 26
MFPPPLDDFAEVLLRFSSQIRIGDMTSVKISPDSRFALINYAPNVCPFFFSPCYLKRLTDRGLIKVVFLWDMQTSQLVRRFLGHQHEQHVLRSSFGGVNDTWVVSGGEGTLASFAISPLLIWIIPPPDQLIYVWHRDTAEILETLDGHKHGSVNSVSWNPVDDGVFASCSDDGTIRIWEAPTWTSAGDSIADSSASSHSSGLHPKALYGIRTNGSNDRAASPNWH